MSHIITVDGKAIHLKKKAYLSIVKGNKIVYFWGGTWHDITSQYPTHELAEDVMFAIIRALYRRTPIIRVGECECQGN